jgi:hypothetical protein
MKDNRLELLKKIAEDMEKDAAAFDGRPFNGRTVAEYFGYHGAAIASLCKILGSILEEVARANKSMENDAGAGDGGGV